MTQWWQWQSDGDAVANSFCVIGVGRFGGAVCRELVRAGQRRRSKAEQAGEGQGGEDRWANRSDHG